MRAAATTYPRRAFLQRLGLVAAGALLSPLRLGADRPAPTPLIIDAHVDLGWNIINFQRDYVRSAITTRMQTAGSPAQRVQGRCMLGLPEWLRGRVALMNGVIFTMPAHLVTSGFQIANYRTPEDAAMWGEKMLDAIVALA